MSWVDNIFRFILGELDYVQVWQSSLHWQNSHSVRNSINSPSSKTLFLHIFLLTPSKALFEISIFAVTNNKASTLKLEYYSFCSNGCNYNYAQDLLKLIGSHPSPGNTPVKALLLIYNCFMRPSPRNGKSSGRSPDKLLLLRYKILRDTRSSTKSLGSWPWN